MKIIKKTKIALLLGIIVVVIPHLVGAVGISPSFIEKPNILKDSTQTTSILVFRDPEDSQEAVYDVKVRGEYAHYIIGPEQLIISAGKDSAQYTFEINPQDAAIGDYEVLIDFLRHPEDLDTETGNGEKNKVGAKIYITTGSTATVKFTVTGEQVLKYELVSFQARDTETDKPLYIDYSINNTGNVEWKPDKIELFFTDVLDDTKKSSIEILSEDIPLVKPGEFKEIISEASHDLSEGAYVGQAKFYYKDELVGKLSSQQFRVYAPGTLDQAGELISVSTNKTDYKAGEKIKLEAVFKNTGEIPVKALLITEIYKDDELKDLLRGQESIIDKGDEITLPQIIELFKSGKYTLSVYVEYGNRMTETKSVEIVVKRSISIVISIIILIIVIAIIFASTLMCKKYNCKKRR
ncbi:MAG: hypothetical protein ABID45_03720 [Patescibacteria group bacterium]